MPSITISGVTIDFPSSSESPNWAEAIIQFAQLVESALLITAGPFDVPNQTQNIDAYNTGSDIDITALNFPSSDVRAAFIKYTVHRETSSTEADEMGMLWVVYNNDLGTWDISQEKSADASITFAIDSTGQVSFTTVALAGTSHTGFISFNAQSLENE